MSVDRHIDRQADIRPTSTDRKANTVSTDTDKKVQGYKQAGNRRNILTHPRRQRVNV